MFIRTSNIILDEFMCCSYVKILAKCGMSLKNGSTTWFTLGPRVSLSDFELNIYKPSFDYYTNHWDLSSISSSECVLIIELRLVKASNIASFVSSINKLANKLKLEDYMTTEYIYTQGYKVVKMDKTTLNTSLVVYKGHT